MVLISDGRGSGVAEDKWDGSLGGDDGDVEWVDEDGWYHPGGGSGGSGGSRGYMGRGAEGSGWDWTGLNDSPEAPMNKRHKHGITDLKPATDTGALFPNKGRAQDMLCLPRVSPPMSLRSIG